MPIPSPTRTGILPILPLATLLIAAAALAEAAHWEAAARPVERAALPAPEPAAPAEAMGPPDPAAIAAALPLLAPFAAATPGAGPLGYYGPLSGMLNTSLPGGPVRGPIWNGAPLPAVGAPSIVIEGEPPLDPEPAAGPAGSSELPDERKLALAHLANPALAAPPPPAAAPTPPAAAPTPAPAVTPERPLTVMLTFPRPPRGHEPGATVPVRVTCNAEAYVVVLGVDGHGRAATLGRSTAPVRSFGVALRAQAEPGPHYLVALASVHPLNGADAAAALRANGTGWVSPVVRAAHEGAAPVAAWETATAHAQGLGGAARGWKRYEWSLNAASFAVKAAAAPPAPAPGEAPAPAGGGSGLPGAPPAPAAAP